MKFVVGVVAFLCALTAFGAFRSLVTWSKTEVASARPGAAVHKQIDAEEKERRRHDTPPESAKPDPQDFSLDSPPAEEPAPAAPPKVDRPAVPPLVVTSSDKPTAPPPSPLAVYTVPSNPTPPVNVDPNRPVSVRLVSRPTTRPTGTQPASQPAELLKYYHLLKNEFIKEPDGFVAIVPDELEDAIARVRDNAASQKGGIDSQISGVTAGIASSEQNRKAAVGAARDNRADARSHARQSTYNHWRVDARGFRTHTHVNGREVEAADAAAGRARMADDAARQQQSSIRSSAASRAQLQRDSAALAGVASGNHRMLLPKSVWNQLPPAQQEQIQRVGLTVDEFRSLIVSIGLTEDEFLSHAKEINNEVRDPDQLTDRLLDYIDEHMRLVAQ